MRNAPVPPYLLWLQITDDGVDAVEDFLNEGHDLPDLHLHKVTPAFLCDLDESVAGHVLYTIMGLCKHTHTQTVLIDTYSTHKQC